MAQKEWDRNMFFSRFMGRGYSPKNKKENIDYMVGYMLNRSQSMFSYDGLPETIPQRMLELYLQTNGNCLIAERNGDLYAFTGGPGGEPDPYYRPTLYTVSNPALNFSKAFRIGVDSVLLYNDSLLLGLRPMLYRFCSALAEAELSLSMALINSRLVDLISAQSDRTKLAADKMIEDIENGKLSVVLDKSLEGTISAFPYAQGQTRTLTEIIEVIQYTKASLFNELGLNANYNMKRESINSGESQLNDDALLPFVDDMLKNRQDGVDAVNKMFGTNISVKLASAWEDNQEEIEAEQEKLEAEGTGDFPVNRKEIEEGGEDDAQ